MKLPPVDQYRVPFIEPIGHLAMQSAFADECLFDLFSACSGTTMDQAASKLRNWDDKAKQLVEGALATIEDESVRRSALECIERYDVLRRDRHRAIHDTITIGIFGTNETGFAIRPVRVEYRRRKGEVESWIHKVWPGQIAELACSMHALQSDMSTIVRRLRDGTCV